MIKGLSIPRLAGLNSLVRFWLDWDREYFSRIITYALPVAMQNFISNFLNMAGVLMIGQLGEVSVASAGLANQIFFLLQLLLFGTTSGSAIFIAQLWGRRNVPSIRKVMGLSLVLGMIGGSFFFLVAELFPTQALQIYSTDPAVIALGSQYLRLFGWAFPFFVITVSFAAVLRSTGEVRIPLVVSTLALAVNTGLSYALIFGKFGFPAMGTIGAAQAGLIARILECVGLLLVVYRFQTPAAASLREMFTFDWPFARTVLKPVLPVAANEMLWSLGTSMYTVVYARIGTESVAAMNIASSVDTVTFVFFTGIATACAILVGHFIGAGDEQKAYQYASRSIRLGLIGGVGMGLIIFLFSPYVIHLYKVSPLVLDYAQKVLYIAASLYWLRMSNIIILLGVLRSGGDTRYALVLDGIIIWILGVPLAFTGAFVFHLPVYWVYLIVMSEEISKWILGLYRFFTRKWIHNLAGTV